MKPTNDRTFCTDGTSLSIQWGRYLYSTPRDDTGPWVNVEVGFIYTDDDRPLTPPETWVEYADGDFPSDVYGYVPIILVKEFIDSHGGYKSGGDLP